MTTAPATASEAPRYRTYGNWTRPQSPGIWGLGTLGTMIVIITPALMVIGFLIQLYLGIAIGVLGALALAPLALTFDGRSLGELAVVRIAWWRTKSRREHVYLSGALAEPYGNHRLPGLLSSSQLMGTRDGLGQDVGIVLIPGTGHYTAVLRCEPEGASLVDREQIDQWVAGYGHWLSSLAHEPGFVGASVTIETAPDPGTRLATAVATQRSQQAPELASSVLDTIIDSYPTGSAQVTAWVTLTYHSTGSRAKKGHEAMINHVASRLPALADGLRGTGAGAVRPMGPTEIAEIVRIAYDPAMATTVEQCRADGTDTGITWDNAGPKADAALWDHYRHDSGITRVWSMDIAPRGTVLAGVLSDLLAPHPQLRRKRVTLTYRPHSPADAAKIVDRDVRTAHFNQEGRGNARDRVTIRAAEQTASEEAEGAGLTRFSLFVAATVTSTNELDDADTILDGLSGTARLQLRPAFNGQRAAFAATLPAGVILPEHVAVPTNIKEAL